MLSSQASDIESPCPVAVTPRRSRLHLMSDTESTDNLTANPVAFSPTVCPRLTLYCIKQNVIVVVSE